MSKTRTIKVDGLARVEGEGGLHVKVRGDRVEEVRLRIFEPPRFFEAFLRGRLFEEVPDITARICGICPVAYQMSAVHAMEDALGIRVDGALRELRRLLYCGEWIESHTLHVAMLHAPDFLGYEDAIRMAEKYPGEVRRALDLKKAGNAIVRAVGGREIHPVNVRVGGFYRVPTRAELAPLVDPLERAREQALDTVRWVSTFDLPDFEQDYEFVALRHPSEYPFNEGRLVSNKGLDIAIRDYDEHFVEEHVAHSNALHSVLEGRGVYLVGPMARYSLNFDRLPPLVQQAARDANLPSVCRNPFQSIVVRAVESLYAVDEALRIIAAYEPPAQPAVLAEARESAGFGCTEAPRGILFHRYRLNADGTIADAKIVPPTSQNQKAIENDLGRFVERHLQLSKEALTWKCEQAVRNYDPCISCATHFLELRLDYVE
jgi:coenzyme F420-reducing hydrogenase alpha subunit